MVLASRLPHVIGRKRARRVRENEYVLFRLQRRAQQILERSLLVDWDLIHVVGSDRVHGCRVSQPAPGRQTII